MKVDVLSKLSGCSFALLLGLTANVSAATPSGAVDLTQTPSTPISARVKAASRIVPKGIITPASFPPPYAILDNFNRADGSLGSNWTVRAGNCSIASLQASCASVGLATFNGAAGAGDTAEGDVTAGMSDTNYVGFVLNYGAGSTNLFIKVQSQGAPGTFNVAACYTGNNGDEFGLGFFDLDTGFSTAHMKVTRVGDDVTIQFLNVNGGALPDQSYTCAGAPAREGSGIGIVGYDGAAGVDNFGSAAVRLTETAPVPALGNLGLGLLIGLLTLAGGFAIRRAR